MSHRVLTAFGTVALVLFAAPAAQAHIVHIDWHLTDTDLVAVAYFDTDLPADDAAVTLHGPDGNVIATGKTDDTGTWRCPKPAPGTYQLHVKAFGSHEKTVAVEIAAPPAPPEPPRAPSESGWGWIAAVVTAIGAVLGAGLWAWRRQQRVTDTPTPLD